MFEKYLEDIGLSEKEASVYLALLSFEKALVSDIAEKAKIKRPTTYVVLETLEKKGLVSESSIDKKTYYIAEPPEKLGMFVDRQIYLLEENKKSLEIVVPKLKSIQREQGEKPAVQFFDSKEGVLSSNDSTFAKKFGDEPVYIIYSRDIVNDIFSEKEASELRERRISMGIKSKSVFNSKEGERLTDETGERLKIEEEKYPITSDITVYGDQVKIAVFGKRISGISIKSQEFADTIKSLINYIFDHK